MHYPCVYKHYGEPIAANTSMQRISPAISKCANRLFEIKFCKRAAAVHAPADRCQNAQSKNELPKSESIYPSHVLYIGYIRLNLGLVMTEERHTPESVSSLVARLLLAKKVYK
ncbi:hypothetical protein Zmor_012143 [Zophobas morio]|jgi:hypothetical protein|uniref:Uncharacterized protein n=1 Tax=Zophobas morio TaxID=2755281 RepID=A0AA38HIE4_9CUCU|nr:hypothetical protein Zmor_012143 [Zophobas morio]